MTRMACSTLTRIGKNTTRMVTTSLGQALKPNHMMNKGAKAALGAICKARI